MSIIPAVASEVTRPVSVVLTLMAVLGCIMIEVAIFVGEMVTFCIRTNTTKKSPMHMVVMLDAGQPEHRCSQVVCSVRSKPSMQKLIRQGGSGEIDCEQASKSSNLNLHRATS